MTSSASTPQFLAPVDIKLNSSNYRKWFTTARIVLLGMDLLGYVDGTSPQPSTPDASWTLADRCTMTIICQFCEIDVRMEIGYLPTAHAMWQHFGHMFEHSSSAHQYVILQDFTHIQQRERSVKEYDSDLQSLWR
ncbi:Retrotransposon Copia-like N-terminal protein [Dioscorea alata]|uniref:Retrotransposon Copia-like N-terminal protein n=1 Tax=Dioscorea alata TaxID=55571 RepID=A0ACB7U5N3_DIOAL|nr:Retrotransposon Copia-like N-terminal protein [Dioscorea alata]